MTVRKFLDLSTGHLTPETRQRIDDGEISIRSVYPHPDGYGWLIYVLPEDYEFDGPADLGKVLEYARHLDCDYVLFDCDGLRIANLPRYEED